MALGAGARKWGLAFVVFSPPMIARLDFTYVSQATRLILSCERQASRTASEMVSATLSGWPSPTDSEEKMNRLLIKCFADSLCVEEFKYRRIRMRRYVV